MLRPFDLLENVLVEIESCIRDGVNGDILARKYSLSEGHLRRLFRFAFKQNISGYIRSRKLAASVDDLLNTNANVLDIALDYGFDYEQSYIRSFKREFGLTPGDLRKTGHIIKVKPPLHLFDESKQPDGVLFGPDIVVVPQFHVAGKKSKIDLEESLTLAPKAAIKFWDNERKAVPNAVNPSVYIGLTRVPDPDADYTFYMPSVQVKTLKNVPHEYDVDTFETSLCARFRYIGKHHYYGLNRDIAGAMYDAIGRFVFDDQSGYVMAVDSVRFERIDTKAFDGTYCQMEWFSPVYETESHLT